MAEPEGTFSNERIKHLEFIQAVVTRLGNGSFLIKGWTLTVVSAFLGVSISTLKWQVALTALVPAAGFWLLDSYFLRQERLFRRLYDDVRDPGAPVEPFSMDTTPYIGDTGWRPVLTSRTILGFYGVLALVSVIVSLVTLGR
ncbi:MULTISPECIES: hypothetical protein [unclassified Actinomadura]|uniref:hypothetical protein n=1 Tax=unclassified Actinomadura TaxID=2626254 RepID=UPI0011EC9598|nr:hypothetical protein [Actinomadura sp. K4S16]